MSDRGSIHIPTIKGRISQKLKQAQSRVEEEEREMEFPEDPAEISLRTPEQRGVVALACLILENLREHGGTRAPEQALEQVLQKTLSTFGPKEVMNIEIEAYEILLWIGNTIEPEWSKQSTKKITDVTPESSTDDLIRWAIFHEEELYLEYYSHSRGELTKRRVTPISLEAETYLHGYCHLRRDERVFRISRISTIEPARGWRDVIESEPEDETDEDVPDSQIDLL